MKLALAAAVFLAPMASWGQETVEIGDGTSTSRQVPINNYYNYSITEMLYTADEIGVAGTISSISFYYNGPAKDFPVVVYMMNVDAADLSEGISLADADEVFNGTYSVTATAGWYTIELSTPFAYDGTSNLLIGINKGYVYYYNQTPWMCTSTSSTMARYSANDNTAPTISTVPSNTSSVRPNIQIEITPSSGPTCPKPDELTAIGTPTAHEYSFSITGGSGLYNIFIKAGDGEWTNWEYEYEETTVNLTGLTPLTNYQVRVQSVCTDMTDPETGDALTSGMKNISFTTAAGIPLNEGFATTSIPTAWTRYNTLLTDDVLNGTTALTSTTSGWNFNTGNGVFDNHAKVNLYGTSCKYWLVTPALTMEDNVQLTFDLALTAYSGTLAAPATTGTDDKFVVLISTDNMATWTILRQWDNAGSEYVLNDIACSATGQSVAIDLSSYAGQSIAIAFYGESTVSNADNNLHIDNVSVDYIPACAKPTGLARSNVTAHTADLSWTAGGSETAWQICVNNDEENLVDVNTNSYQLTSLTAETAYSVKVRANCGGTYSGWTNAVNFTTAIACPVPTSFTTSNIGAYSVTLSWTENAGASEWVVAYKTNDDEEFTEVTVTENPYTLTGLNPETGYTVKVKAVCGGIDGESLYTTTRSFTTTEACPAPGNLTVTDLTVTGATLSWTELGDGTSWFICLDDDEENLIEVNATSYTFTELQSETVHTAKVKSNCGTAWSSIVEFEPTAKLVIGSGTSTSQYLPVYTLYKQALNQQIYTVEELGDAGVIESIDFYCTQAPSTKPRVFNIYMVSTDKSEFESTTDWVTVTEADKVYSGSRLFTTGWNSFVFDNPFIYDGTNNVVLVIDDNTGDYNGTNYFRVFNATAQTLRIYSDNANYDPTAPTYTGTIMNVKNQIRLLKNEIPSCVKPTGVTVNYTGGTSVEVSWTSEATSFALDVNGTVTYNVPNPTTITGLDLATTYNIKVQADCGNDGTSDWTTPVSFTTDLCMPDDQCDLTFVLTDAWGDGWNGAYIEVIDVATTSTIAQLANENLNGTTGSGENEENTLTLPVCQGRTLQFVWHSGSYDSEASYTVTDINEEVIFEGTGAMSDPVSYTVNCTPAACTKPTGLTVANVTGNSAEISWTPAEDNNSWDVYLGDEFVANVSTASYTFTGLDGLTEYTAGVKAKCEGANADMVSTTFTTPVNCGNADECQITIVGHDSYGDGWNGNAIDIIYNNVSLGTFTLTTGGKTEPYSESFTVCQGMPLSFVYTVDQYAYETSWEILAGNGDMFAEGMGSSSMTTGTVVATIDNPCPVVYMPTDLTAEIVNGTTATLSWTRNEQNGGNETYTVLNNGEMVASGINANNYNVDIEPNTDYSFAIYATLDNENSFVTEAVNLGLREFATETGKMVYLSGTILNISNVDATATLYRGMGENLTEQDSYTGSTYLTQNTTSYTANNEWTVYGPMTVAYVGKNVTLETTGIANLNYGTECPAYKQDYEPLVVNDAVESYTWNTAEGDAHNHTYTYGPVHGTTLGETVNVLNGTYSDTVRNAGGCDSVYRHLTLTIYPTYEVTLTDQFCEGTVYTVGAGEEAHEYTASTMEDVHLTAVGGADSLVHVDIHMNIAPVALINNKVSDAVSNFCDGFEMTLTASAVEGASAVANATFEWENGTTDATRVEHPAGADEIVYTLMATDPLTGCTSLEPAVLTVTTQAVPALTVNGDADICLGQTATLTVTDANAIAGVNFRWRNYATGAVVGTGATLTVTPNETMTYSVTAEGTCEVVSEPFTVTVHPLPVVTVSTDLNALCASDALTLSATEVEGYSYLWSNGATTAVAIANPTVSGSFTLTVTDGNSCSNTFTTANVTVYPKYELDDQQSVCFTQNPYVWGDKTLTEDGNYDQTFPTVNGCDSLVHLTFSFEEMSVENTYRTVCQGAEVTWGDETINAEENTTLSYVDQSGDCPAQRNLVLTVNPVVTSSFDQTACDTYTWVINGETIGTYTESCAPSTTLQTVAGCDSMVTMNLTVNYRNSGIDEQVACDRYEWIDGNIYTENNTTAQYTLSGTNGNVYGCDSVVTLNLTVNYSKTENVSYRECEHKSFVWSDGNGQTYNLNVTPEDNVVWNLTEANPEVKTTEGCDTLIRLNLVMNYVTDTLNWANVTACDNYYIDTVACDNNIGRKYISESGDYVLRTRNAASGRDQISRIHLTIISSDHHTVVKSECVPYTWEYAQGLFVEDINPVLSNDTVVYREIEVEGDCNIIETLRLHAKRPTERMITENLCQDGSWTNPLDETDIRMAADYELGENEPFVLQTLAGANAEGCDSVEKVTFIVYPVYTDVTAEETYCESAFVNNVYTYVNPNNAQQTVELTIPGALNEMVYTNSVTTTGWTTAMGCDSNVTISYTVNPTTSGTDVQSACYEYTWIDNVTYTENNTTATKTLVDVNGCDSIVTLNLTIFDSVVVDLTQHVCDEYTWEGQVYREDSIFREAGQQVAAPFCDSITYTGFIVEQRVMQDQYVVTNQPYTWADGVTYTESVENKYYDATGDRACDSILNLHLTMEDDIVLCGETLPYTYGNNIFTIAEDAESGVFDSIDNQGNAYHIAYTINRNTDTEETVTNCDSYTWQYKTEPLTVSGDYTEEFTDDNGCVANHILHLTINNSTEGTVTATACDSYEWNEVTYTQSGTYTYSTTNLAGCDSTATLTLTINNNSNQGYTVAACESYTWERNNTNYTASGDYTYEYTSTSGCPSVDTLHLTINNNVEKDTSIARYAASAYFDGNYYQASTEPYTGIDSIATGVVPVTGCDSIYHVTLYVGLGDVTNDDTTVCGDYTWRDGHTYQWISDAEKAAHGNALYKDITDTNNVVYIHAGENPTYILTDGNGQATMQYILWLTLAEAKYSTVDLGDVLLSNYPNGYEVGNDTLGTVILDFSEYINNHQGGEFSQVVRHSGVWYCGNVITYNANLVWNYDTIDTAYVCNGVTTYDWTIGDETFTETLTGDESTFTETFADGTPNEMVNTITVVRNSAIVVVDTVAVACDEFTWYDSTYTASATPTHTFQVEHNGILCDSVVTLTLTINSSNTGDTTAVACDSFDWYEHTNITGSCDTLTHVFANANAVGCDSTVTLHLTINTNAGLSETNVACNSFTWLVPSLNPQTGWENIENTYTDGGVKTVTFNDANGCAGTATLTLTINTNAGIDTTVANCNSYTWTVQSRNSISGEMEDIVNEYTGSASSGDKQVTFFDVNGCEGTATLHLTVYDPIALTDERYAFGNGVTLYGIFYTPNEDGSEKVYTNIMHDTVDEHGCATQVNVTLHVTQYEYYFTNKVACGRYQWNDGTHGNGHVYRCLTADERTANPTALYFDSTANAVVTEQPRYQAESSNLVDILNLTLNEPIINSLAAVSIPLSQLANQEYTYTTVDGDIDCAAAEGITADTSITKDFSKGPYGACDSIVRYTVNIVYNYFTDNDTTLCDATSYTLPNAVVKTVTPGYDSTFVYVLNAGEATEEVHTVVVTDVARTVLDDVTVTLCASNNESYTWAYNGQVYSETTSLTLTNDTVTICNQQTLNLTVYPNASHAVTAVTACDSYAWTVSGETYTTSGNKTYSYSDGNSCPAVDTLPLTIHHNSGHHTDVSACVSYTWTDGDGTDYTVSGTYTYNYNDGNGCASIDTLNLTINTADEADVTFWEGNGSFRYTEGFFTDDPVEQQMYMARTEPYSIEETVTGAGSNGCDSIYHITLYVGNDLTHTDREVACETFVWQRNGHEYQRLTAEQQAANPTALYYDATDQQLVFINPTHRIPQEGTYDSVYMLMLTLDGVHVDNVTIDNIPVSLGSYTYDPDLADTTYTFADYNVPVSVDELRGFTGATITDELHLTSLQFCDSVTYLTLNIVNNYVKADSIDLSCTVDSYTWRGHTLAMNVDYDNEETYYIYDTVGEGLQTVVNYLIIVKHPVQYYTERITACDSYTWVVNGEEVGTFTESTTQTRTFQDQYGTDSIVTLMLTINHNSGHAETVVACDSYEWHGVTYTESVQDVYYDYRDANNCLSQDTLLLTVKQHLEAETSETVCDSYTWNGHTYTTSGDYNDTTTGSNNCDSITTLHLTVNYSGALVHDGPVSVCNSYEWHGQTWNGTEMVDTLFGVYTETAASLTAQAYNEYGCPIPHDISLLTVNYSGQKLDPVTACDSYLWYNDTYTESGEYYHVSVVNNACQTFTDTLDLTVNYGTYTADTVIECNQYEWHEVTYTESGTYFYNYTNLANCPSVDTLYLTIGNGRAYSRVTVTACDRYDWMNGDELLASFTESIETSKVLRNPATGCDSIAYLTLTVNHSSEGVDEHVACVSYEWPLNGVTYTASTDEPTVTLPAANAAGCDSVVTLHLTINEVLHGIDEQVACDSYTWPLNGETYTASTNEPTVTLTSLVSDCDSIVTLHLTINQNGGHAETVSYCDSYTWHGQTYDASGDYYYDYEDGAGCSGQDTLHLTISSSIVNTFVRTACDSYLWVAVDGTEVGNYTTSGIYTYNYTTTENCSGTETLVLTVNRKSEGSVEVTACDSYLWNGETYTEDGTYTYTTTNSVGCDSIATLTLTVNNSVATEITESDCGVHFWNSQFYTESGDYQQTFEAANGCDSVVTLHLTINQPVTVTIDTTACGYFSWNGIRYESSDVIIHTYTAANGCDSTEVINLTVNRVGSSFQFATACDSYTWDVTGQTYTTSGARFTILPVPAANGCDSTATLQLTLHYSAQVDLYKTACDSYEWNDVTYDQSGDYSVSGTTVAGCDSTTTLHLTVNYSTSSNEETTVCNRYFWNGETYTQSGTYTYNTTNSVGCDSIATLVLTVNTPTTGTETVTACGSYEWNEVVYTQSGTYTYNTTNLAGCDSVATLVLTVNTATSGSETVTACDSYEWNDVVYTASGVYTYNTTNVAGCDSTATLILAVNASTHNAETVAACNAYTWNNTEYSASGTYTYNYTNNSGCASTDTLHLTINTGTSSSETTTVCDSYLWNGVTYTQSGTYTYNTTNAAGCDSVATLVLTVNTATSGTETVESCNSYEWHGQTYNQSGLYSYTTTNAAGCDSVANLVLIIKQPYATTVNQTACDSYTWSDGDGQTYDASGLYNYTTIAANGCDSVVTLNLTINNSVVESFDTTVCGSFAWNGSVYAESGEYMSHAYAANGCDSTVTLNLTVNAVTYGDTVAAACSSFEWYGVIHTLGGTYQQVMVNEAGCDSIVTLHLTINQPVSASVYETACDSYLWNGETYTTSGEYNYTTTGSNGCDSTTTLYLTIGNSVTTTVYETAVESYVWNGTVYTASGVYTWHGTTVLGCDSTVTLNLTITEAVPDSVTVTFAVNDALMGTIVPAGTHVYAVGDHVSITATANEGYHLEGWRIVSAVIDTLVVTPVTTYELDMLPIMEGLDVVVTAQFAANPVEPVTVTFTIAVDNPALGTTTPAPGTYSYEVGTTLSLTATPANGCQFMNWTLTSHNGEEIGILSFEPNVNIAVTEAWEGAVLTAYFWAVEGIDEVDEAVSVAAVDNRIVVRGAEGSDIYVYDVNGRCVSKVGVAAATEEVTVNATGVYLVKVGNAPAKRVVVVR